MMSNASTSVIGLLLQTEGIRPFYKRFRATNDDRGFYLEQLINRAHKRLRFISGEINPWLWEIPRVINALDSFLIDKTHVVEFTFTKIFNGNKQKSIEETDIKKKLEEENKNLVALAKKRKDQIKFYFFKDRAEQHCQINDNNDIILEEPRHPPGGAKWVDVVFNYEDLSSDWIKLFDQITKREDKKVITIA